MGEGEMTTMVQRRTKGAEHRDGAVRTPGSVAIVRGVMLTVTGVPIRLFDVTNHPTTNAERRFPHLQCEVSRPRLSVQRTPFDP